MCVCARVCEHMAMCVHVCAHVFTGTEHKVKGPVGGGSLVEGKPSYSSVRQTA